MLVETQEVRSARGTNYILNINEPDMTIQDVIDYGLEIRSPSDRVNGYEIGNAKAAQCALRRLLRGESTTEVTVPFLKETELLHVEGTLVVTEELRNLNGSGIRAICTIEEVPDLEDKIPKMRVTYLGYTKDPQVLQRIEEDARNTQCDGIGSLTINSQGRPQQEAVVTWPR